MVMGQKQLRLERLGVKDLFGHFNYHVPLNPDGITLLTGPNGYGKTTLLQAVKAMSVLDLAFFNTTPFRSMSFGFDQNQEVNFTRMPSNLTDVNINISAYSASLFGSNEFGLIDRTGNPVQLTSHPNILPFLLVEDLRLQKSASLSPSTLLDASGRFAQGLNQKKTQLSQIPDAFINVFHNTQAAVLRTAQKLDMDLPHRLVEHHFDITKDDFETRFARIQSLQKKLHTYGLADSVLETLPAFSPDHAKFLNIVTADLEMKVGAYHQLLAQVELFLEILNQRRFHRKQAVIHASHGLKVMLENGEELAVDHLSNGEKHALLLLYKLIFETKPGDLVLIDEPEMSLHVAWQHEFLNDLTRIRKLNGIDVMIATHSPQIIDDHWDWVVDLEEISD